MGWRWKPIICHCKWWGKIPPTALPPCFSTYLPGKWPQRLKHPGMRWNGKNVNKWGIAGIFSPKKGLNVVGLVWGAPSALVKRRNCYQTKVVWGNMFCFHRCGHKNGWCSGQMWGQQGWFGCLWKERRNGYRSQRHLLVCYGLQMQGRFLLVMAIVINIQVQQN